MTFHVYLLIGDDGEPFYIGQSTDVRSRLASHRRDKTRYAVLGSRTKSEATQRVDLIECSDHAEMRAVEKQLIEKHRPVLNKAVPVLNEPVAMTPEQRTELRNAGRRAATKLPDLSPQQCRRIAEMLRGPVNELISAQRTGATNVASRSRAS